MFRETVSTVFQRAADLIDLFDGRTLGSAPSRGSARSTGARETPGVSPGTSGHPPAAASTLVQLGHYRRADFLQFLLFVLKLILLSQLQKVHIIHTISISKFYQKIG